MTAAPAFNTEPGVLALVPGAAGPGLETDAPLPEEPPEAVANIGGTVPRQPGTEHAGERARRYRLLDAEDLLTLPPPAWRIDNLLPQGGVAVLYGLPGCGKSFVALSFALCIAARLPWVGRPTTWAPTLYAAGEGVHGLGSRVRAFLDAHAVTAPQLRGHFYATDPLNLLDAAAVADLVSELPDIMPGLLTIDTVARAMPGADENSARDMGAMIAAVDRIRGTDPTLTTLLVHHTGKDGENERGSSALRGAADVMLRLENDGGQLTLTVTKQRDAAAGDPIRLRLLPFGGSCIVEPLDRTTAPEGLTRSQRVILETLRDVAVTAEGGACSTVIGASNLPQRTAFAALKAVAVKGYVAKLNRRYVLTPLGEAAILGTAGVLQ